MLAWLLAAHVLGVILWAAGVFGAGRALIDHARLGTASPELSAVERRLLLRCAHPGMTLAIVAGAWAISLNPNYYLKEGWMLAKLAAAALAVAATIVLSVASKRMITAPASAGERSLQIWRGLFMGAIAAALVLVFVKPI
jgi:uncharacterized membrane protein